MKYGQQDFDFDEGVMHFMSPKQVLLFKQQQTKSLNIRGGYYLSISP